MKSRSSPCQKISRSANAAERRSLPWARRKSARKSSLSQPLYRQEQEWKGIGLMLSRATLSNWVIRPTEDWLMPVVERMHMHLLQLPVIHADETPVQVLNEKNRKNTTKSFMWVY